MQPVRIIGTGVALPGAPVENQVMEAVFGLRAEWIEQLIGTRTRHFAVDLASKQVRETLTDLASEAGRQALQNAALSPEEIDLVVMSTATPDHLMPSTVNLAADRLGINGVATYQIQAGCSGAYQALDVACGLLAAGRFHTALVLGGDVCNKYMDFSRDFTRMRSSELINLALFGDGAGAAVLTTQPRQGLLVRHVLNRCEGQGRKPGQVMNWFGSAAGAAGQQAAKEDYKAIEESVPRMACEVLQELFARLGWERDQVDHYLPPQLGGHMTDSIVRRMEIPADRAINPVAETGNNGNALPFIQLHRLRDRMQPGQRALGVGIESSKWLKVGIALEG